MTLVSENTYCKMWPHNAPPLEPSSMELRTYTGEQLEVCGCVSVWVKYKDQEARLPLLVVRGAGPSLLGQNWLLKLKLDWQGIYQVQHIRTLQEILQKHASLQGRAWGTKEHTSKITGNTRGPTTLP